MKSKNLLSIKNLKIKKKICVIGSSKILLKQKNGNLINKFDNVVRFNRSQIKGYEKHVGTKTTLRVLNNHVFMNFRIWGQTTKEQFFAKNLKNSEILIISPSEIKNEIFEKNRSNYNDYYYLNSKRILLNSLVYFIFDINIILKIFKILTSRLTYSVGLTFIMYLLMKNIRPTLFGFDLNEIMNNRSHYYGKPGKPGNRHNLFLEHKIIKELIKKNYLDLN